MSERGSVHVKVCGVTNVEDATACIAAGVSAIGLNFVPGTPRFVKVDEARRIARSIGGKALVVGVVANLSVEQMIALRDDLGLGCLQLHGDESPDALLPLLPHAYKAVRVGGPADVAQIDRFPGEHVLVDAKVDGVLGGSGVRVDPVLVAGIARRRKLTLAGGLTPENVAGAVRAVRPFAVDVASGVELRGDPRRKDGAAIEAFVAAARRAAEEPAG